MCSDTQRRPNKVPSSRCPPTAVFEMGCKKNLGAGQLFYSLWHNCLQSIFVSNHYGSAGDGPLIHYYPHFCLFFEGAAAAAASSFSVQRRPRFVSYEKRYIYMQGAKKWITKLGHPTYHDVRL